MHGYLLVLLMTFFRRTVHITVLAFYWCVGFWALVRFTYNTRGVTLMVFSISVMFKVGLTEIDTTEEASNARDGMIMFIVD